MPALRSSPTVAASRLSDFGLPLHGLEATLWAPSCAPVGGAILEMSPRDLKLQIDGIVQLGTMVELELRSTLFDFSCSVRGQVHWQLDHPERFVVGVFLNRALSYDVVGHYWSDLRKELRYDCDWSCRLYSPRRRRTHSACLLNYSRSGILIASDFPAVSGDEIALIDASRPDTRPIVSGIVRWQAPHAGNQELLGCELPEEDGVRLSAYLRSLRGGA